ncbi:hypothetical protein ACFVUP_38940 [Streptomyces bacillaris]|uniref:hypothetical protein n=1 Tax=Streptomyces bacillaris TaxID=68179 RepID=UPI0036DB98A2
MAGRKKSDIAAEGQPAVVAIHQKDAPVHAGVFLSIVAGQVYGCTGGTGWTELIERTTTGSTRTDTTLAALRRLARRRGERLTELQQEVITHVSGDL